MKRFQQVLVGLNLLVILCTVLALLSPVVHPKETTLPGLMALMFPMLLVANVCFCIGWILVKKYTALLSLTVLVFSWDGLLGIVKFTPPIDHEPSEKHISLTSFNMRQLLYLDDIGRPSLDRIKVLIDDLESPDILCVQEGGQFKEYASELGYKSTISIPNSSNQLVTKFPVIDHSVPDLSPAQSLSAWFDIVVETDTIRVFLLYLSSNRITAQSEELLDKADLSDTRTWRTGLRLFKRYAGATVIRAHQSVILKELIAASPYPVLLGGDFNDIPLSYAVNAIAGDMQDSFREQGFGLGTTYAGRIPGLRIDYVLADDNFEILRHTVKQIGVSDHHAVVTEVRIKDL